MAAASHPKICSECARTFEGSWGPQRFCSRSCARLHQRVLRSRQCECGKIFRPRHSRHRSCSLRCAARWSRPPKVRGCLNCAARFESRCPTRFFCSRACAREVRAAQQVRTCPVCGSGFGSVDSRQRFCSRECAVKGKRRNRGSLAYNWKGGRSMSNGYVLVRAPAHPRASKSKPYVFEHILVMEAILGRYLLPHERVHHKTGQRDDNRPENLELWRVKDPPGVRAADYHCPGCRCAASTNADPAAHPAHCLSPAQNASAIAETREQAAVPSVGISRAVRQPRLRQQEANASSRANAPLGGNRKCAWCRNTLTRTQQRCCSRSCARRYEQVNYYGGHAPGWKGGRSLHSSGYVWAWAPDHPRARTTPYVLEHILVMEKVLGRTLESNERIHHRNGRRDDNRPENLELWRTKDPPGVRAADYHCSGCNCDRSSISRQPKQAESALLAFT